MVYKFLFFVCLFVCLFVCFYWVLVDSVFLLGLSLREGTYVPTGTHHIQGHNIRLGPS